MTISQQTGVFITHKAAHKFDELRQKEGKRNWGFRFADQPGFCGAGYEYKMDIAPTPNQEDIVFHSHGIDIFVPRTSLQRLDGSVIDFLDNTEDLRFDDLARVGFTVSSNPNVKGACPCACNKGFDF
ncbi:MAG: HesB/IscA family protein [Rhabdochlamydiaceae bacterium]